ncbi:MAG: LamG-like jellyroll fold domain-containing protein [Pseudomonadota bacterium]
MTTTHVSNASELMAALGSASGGDTIVLKDGYYGDVRITHDFPSDVSIVSETPQGASFGNLRLQSTNTTFDSIKVNGTLTLYAADTVTVSNSRLSGFNEVNYSKNITITGNDIGGGTSSHGLFVETSSNFSITNNVLHDVDADMMRVMGNSYNGLIENNTFDDTSPYKNSNGTYVHSDMLQMFGRDNGTPHDIVIRGNMFYDDPNTGDTGNLWAQGIFLSDAGSDGYRDILIEQNMLSIGSPNTIFVKDGTGAQGVEILNNTLLPWPNSSGGDGGTIRLIGRTDGVTVDGNVSAGIINEGYGANIGSNYTYSKNASAGNYYGKLLSGDGSDWQDYVPVTGSPIDFGSGFGALGRLSDLSNGGQPAPAPTPDPTNPPDTGGGNDPAGGDGSDSSNGSSGNDTISVPSDANVAFAMLGSRDIDGRPDVVELKHPDELELSAATLSFSFNANAVGGTRTLISKDAAGDGHHFSAYLKKGVLHFRFQDGDTTKTIKAKDIKFNTDYDVQVAFGDGGASVWVNGGLVGATTTNIDWSQNNEFLQIGANGWFSGVEQDGFRYAFYGTISDVLIVEGINSPNQMNAILEEVSSPSSGNGGTQNGGGAANTGSSSASKVLGLDQDIEVRGRSEDVINLKHQSTFEIDEGTIEFQFNADSVNGRSGLISKDAYGFAGGGNHFAAWIENGVLKVRFQDGQVSSVFQLDNIKANTDYDVTVYFEKGEVGVYVNGTLIGTSVLTMDWTQNEEYLQVGGLGWASDTGDDSFSHAFDGTISDLAIYDTALTPSELEIL